MVFLDTIPVDDIVRFEEEFHTFFDAHYPEILETIRETKDLPEEAVLDAAITEFLNQPASNKNRGVDGSISK